MTYIDLYGALGLLTAIALSYISNARYEKNERRMDGLFLFYVAAASYAMCIWLFTREAGKYPSPESISLEQWNQVKHYLTIRSAVPIAMLFGCRTISGRQKSVSYLILFFILAATGIDMYYVTDVFPRYAALLHRQ